MSDRENVAAAANRWFQFAADLGWRSYDPFDVLASPYLGRLQKVSPFGSRVAIQLGKRSGAWLRAALHVEPHEEAKTLSDFLSAAALLARCGLAWAEPFLQPLQERLLGRAIPTGHGLGWGLEFPYTSRFVTAPARTANAYQTANAVEAFLDVHALTGDTTAWDAANQGTKCLLLDLGEFEFGGHTWLRYWPGRDMPACNVQALLAGVLSRMGRCAGDRHYQRLAARTVGTVVDAQRADGSWRYSEDGRADFVDGFHTGFILQGLAQYLEYGDGSDAGYVSGALDRGFAYFKRHLLSDDAMPRYNPDGPISFDGQNFAQCVQTLLVCAQDRQDLEVAGRVWRNMLSVFESLPAAGLVRGRRALGPNYPELRWTVGPAVLATAYLVAHVEVE